MGRGLLNIKLQLNTFRNDRIRTLNVFCASVKWHPCLSVVAQKLIKSKLSNVRMEYKKFFKLAKVVLKIWCTQNLQL
ncbi:hypothetical protein O3M35_003372 [Rhynocoris fuscipes]|uniref:Uncharacterized protein n=1 Tax=Rhynocoris fuscipes TaxID=488301 RepID=A0AAW1CL61_9HEMI